jgi:hypothetical protein
MSLTSLSHEAFPLSASDNLPPPRPMRVALPRLSPVQPPEEQDDSVRLPVVLIAEDH